MEDKNQNSPGTGDAMFQTNRLNSDKDERDWALSEDRGFDRKEERSVPLGTVEPEPTLNFSPYNRNIKKVSCKRKLFFCFLIGISLLCIGGTNYHYSLLVNNLRMKFLSDMPINDHCAIDDLSTFDKFVCSDDKFDNLFMVYVDGTPYELYKDFIEMEPYKNISSAVVSINQGINDSGPSLRSTLLGRYDIDYKLSLNTTDNHNHQFLRSVKNNMSMMIWYDYPMQDVIRNESFSYYQKMKNIEDGPGGLCPELFVMNNHTTDYNCDEDPLGCRFSSVEDAKNFVKTETQFYLNQLMKNKEDIEKCLEGHLKRTPSILTSQEYTDHMAHRQGWMSKKTLGIHASTRANLIMITEYIRKNHPSTLIAFYSDHGANFEIWDGEWTDHGNQQGTNNGFMMTISDRFTSKTKKNPVDYLDTTNIWSPVSMSLKNVNLPRYHKYFPEPKFQDDQGEALQVYRSREHQLASVLGKLQGDSPLVGKIEFTKTVKENIEKLGKETTENLLSEYRAWLIDQEPAFEREVKSIISRDFGFVANYFLPWFTLLSAITVGVLVCITPLIRQQLFPFLSWPLMMLLLWISLLCVEGAYTNFGYYSMSCHFLLAISIVLQVFDRRRKKVTEDQTKCSDMQFFSRTGIVLSGIIITFRVCFTVSTQTQWNLYLVYFENRPATLAGWLIMTFSTGFLLRESWRLILQAMNGSWKNYGKFKTFIQVVNTAAIVIMIFNTIIYEAVMLKNKTLENTRYQTFLSGSFELLFIFVSITSNVFFFTIGEKSLVIVNGIVFMSFWACNLNRILLSTIIVPLLILFMRKAPFDKRFESPVFVVQMVVFLVGFFNCTGELYRFDASKRVISRYPGDAETQIYLIKFSSALLVNCILAVVKVNWTLLEEYAFLFCYVLAFYPLALTMTATDKLKPRYPSFLICNVRILAIYGMGVKLLQVVICLNHQIFGYLLNGKQDLVRIAYRPEVEISKFNEDSKKDAHKVGNEILHPLLSV